MKLRTTTHTAVGAAVRRCVCLTSLLNGALPLSSLQRGCLVPALLVPLRTCHIISYRLTRTSAATAEQRGARLSASIRSVHGRISHDDQHVETSFATTSYKNQKTLLLHKRKNPRRHGRCKRDRSRTLSLPYNKATTAPSFPLMAAYQLSPLETMLCERIQLGEWIIALELLQKQSDIPMPDATTSPQALKPNTAKVVAVSAPERSSNKSTVPVAHEHQVTSRSSPISLEEQCIWLLLWYGQEDAAWRVWRWTQAQQPLPSSTALYGVGAVSLAPSACVFNARLVLVLTLFLHFVAQDGQRTRDLLLLGEVMWRAKGSAVAAERPSLSSESAVSSSSTQNRSLKENSTVSQDVSGASAEKWIPLFVAWLRCLVAGTPAKAAKTDELPSSYAHFHNTALRRIAFCVENGQREADATVVALLLLSAYEQLSIPLDMPEAEVAVEEVFCSSSVSMRAIEVVESEFRHGVRMLQGERQGTLECARCGISTDSSVPVFQHLPQERMPLHGSLLEKTREIFVAAAHQLLRFHRSSHRSQGSSKYHARQKGAHVLARLPIYQFWFRQLTSVLGCADMWAALVDASEKPITNTKSTEGSLTLSSSIRLKQINAATDRSDWAAALHLCLLPPTDSQEAVQLPWLRLLRKGLTACEVAAKKSNSTPWQGALALWRFAQTHHNNDDDACHLTREYGRIFMLLASATRWSEALQCFHATPARLLDGFVVAQVGYALRASAEHLDEAVLDLWAAWRCRVGDSVEPREEAVVQLLQAMLHMSTSSPKQQSMPSTTFSSSTTTVAVVADKDAHRVDSASTTATSPVVVVSPADVATKLLIAAANTSTNLSHTESRDHEARDALQLPGTQVPLDWRRRHHLVHRLLQDRWTGDWAEALRVALASTDVSLLRTVAARVPRGHHHPTLYTDTIRALRRRGVELTTGDRAALWALWGNAYAPDGSAGRDSVSGQHGDPVHARPQRFAAGVKGKGVDVAQVTQNTESLLDELLGAEREKEPQPQSRTN